MPKPYYTTVTPEIRRERMLESQARGPLKTFRDWAKPVKRKGASRRRTGWLYQHRGRWTKLRTAFIKRNPLCANCGAAAVSVDHKVPHKGSWELFWDEGNWQSLCTPCHENKTRIERSLPRL